MHLYTWLPKSNPNGNIMMHITLEWSTSEYRDSLCYVLTCAMCMVVAYRVFE